MSTGLSNSETWVCHTHELIGTEDQALEHAAEEGCTVQQLSPETAKAVRDAQWEIQRLRVAHLLAYRRLVNGDVVSR